MRPLDVKLLTFLVKEFFPDFGYLDFHSGTNTYWIGDGDFLMAFIKNDGPAPILMLRAGTQATDAAKIGSIVSLCCDFVFGRTFELSPDGEWVYGLEAKGLAAANIYRLWFDVPMPIHEDGSVGFIKKTKGEKSEMN